MTVERFLMEAKYTPPVYVEDVFSTYIYTGTAANLTITNNIDLSTKGGLVWIKNRGSVADHLLFDTTRGTNKYISSDNNQSQDWFGAVTDTLTSFNSTGFSLGADATAYSVNRPSGNIFASWTFRKQPKFFDIVTFTGTGSARTISHNLGSTPGMIIVKRTDTTANWPVYHSGMTSAAYYVTLNGLIVETSDSTVWNSTAPTSSVFSVGTSTLTNANTGTYVAYLFASDAGGFGLSGTDSIVKCGTFTTDASGYFSVNLGWEPQYILYKTITGTNDWVTYDTMRGCAITYSSRIDVGDTGTETNVPGWFAAPNATGFSKTSGTSLLDPSVKHIYLAIRRGPMKTPTSGTSVFQPNTRSGNGVNGQLVTASITPDLMIPFDRSSAIGAEWTDRLRGNKLIIYSYATTAEQTGTGIVGVTWDQTTGNQNGYYVSSTGQANSNYSGDNYVDYLFSRAPGFFDVVCYTGNAVSGRSVDHNLTVAPELIIVKGRSNTQNWAVYSATLGATNNLTLNTQNAKAALGYFTATPTSSVFYLDSDIRVNASAVTYVAYLFATCAGVSKVGSYTGTAAAQNIDCGFASGARFVMIKRTDSTGAWYVYDSARGINASGSNDPYLWMNSQNAEVTNTDYLGTYSSGFALTSTAPAAMNASGGTFIYLAIA